MCNLYSMTSNAKAIRAMTGAMRDTTGNLPPPPGISSDYAAPIVRNPPDGRKLAMVRGDAHADLDPTQGSRRPR